MSTKCTVLHGKNYHFYFEQMEDKYILQTTNNGFNEFLQRAGKLLETHPKSDAGIYLIDLNTGKSKKIRINKDKKK